MDIELRTPGEGVADLSTMPEIDVNRDSCQCSKGDAVNEGERGGEERWRVGLVEGLVERVVCV